MKIAIIGSGIAGLVAARHLHRDHDITVFEAQDYPGGHSNTVDVEMDGRHYPIDTGFIVFNDWTYPNFIRLLDELKVASQPTTMSFSVRDDQSGLEYNGHSLNTLFAQRRNLFKPRFHRMVYDILRFNRQAQKLAEQNDTNQTVGEFLDANRYSAEFRNQYLLPMGSAIWSCPTGVFAEFPIRFIADFYRNHGLLNVRNRPTWRVIQGGSRTYVQALVSDFKDRIRLGTPVRKVCRAEDGVQLSTESGTERFEHVIFACHSDQALKILGGDATNVEREILSEFPYSRNVAVLHTDESVLPKSRRAWGAWNYRARTTDSGGADNHCSASVTYNMNILQRIESPHTFCVTLNDETAIDPGKILQTFVYHHPVFTMNRAAAQSRHAELINRNRTSYCGAYWRNGFHEDGVVSALAVVRGLSPGERGSAELAGETNLESTIATEGVAQHGLVETSR